MTKKIVYSSGSKLQCRIIWPYFMLNKYNDLKLHVFIFLYKASVHVL